MSDIQEWLADKSPAAAIRRYLENAERIRAHEATLAELAAEQAALEQRLLPVAKHGFTLIDRACFPLRLIQAWASGKYLSIHALPADNLESLQWPAPAALAHGEVTPGGGYVLPYEFPLADAVRDTQAHSANEVFTNLIDRDLREQDQQPVSRRLHEAADQ